MGNEIIAASNNNVVVDDQQVMQMIESIKDLESATVKTTRSMNVLDKHLESLDMLHKEYRKTRDRVNVKMQEVSEHLKM